VSRPTTDRTAVAALVLGFCLAGCSIVRDPDPYTREARREPSTLAAFLSEGQEMPAPDRTVDLEFPIRIGLTFLPPAGNISDAVPSADQRVIAMKEVRDAMLSLPYVSEVVASDFDLQPGMAGGFEKLSELSRRFDFDVLAVLSSDQTSYETQNFRSLALLTVIGAGIWKGDVDKTVTSIELAIVDPQSRTVVMRVASAAVFGDTTTILDDWRSSNHVRRVSFDEARVALVHDLPKKLGELRSRLDSPAVQRP
jgi:rhombotail lipoprotein